MKNNINLKKIAVLFSIAFVLNFIWENLHHPLYAHYNSTMLFNIKYLPLMIYASFIDALIISAIYFLIVFLSKEFDLSRTKGKVYFVIVTFIIAIVIEKRALSIGKWSYAESMPLVLGIGLTPLVQLAVTGVLSIWSLERLINKEGLIISLKGGRKNGSKTK